MMAGMEAGTSAPRSSSRRRLSRDRQEAEFARLLAFSDGVFAIAITLLVLQLEVPADAADLGSSLRDAWPDLFAFGLSFAVLGRFWWVFHHRLFSGLAEFDGRLVAFNFVYLALVTLVPFTSDVLGEYGDESEAVIVYAVNLGLLGLVGAVMVRYAFAHELMKPGAREEFGPHGRPNWAIPIVFFASIPIALVSPIGATLFWLAAQIAGHRLFRLGAERGNAD
jgi:uncharacterized membrane protein